MQNFNLQNYRSKSNNPAPYIPNTQPSDLSGLSPASQNTSYFFSLPDNKKADALETFCRKISRLTLYQRATLPYVAGFNYPTYLEIKEKAIYHIMYSGDSAEKLDVVQSLMAQENDQKLPEEIRARCSFIRQILGIKKTEVLIPNVKIRFDYKKVSYLIETNLGILQSLQKLSFAEKAFLPFDKIHFSEITRIIADSLCRVLSEGNLQEKTHAAYRLVESSQSKNIPEYTKSFLKSVIAQQNITLRFTDLEPDQYPFDSLDLTGLTISFISKSAICKHLEYISCLSLMEQACAPYMNDGSEEHINLKEEALTLIINQRIPEQQIRVLSSLVNAEKSTNLSQHLTERCSIILQILGQKNAGKIANPFNLELIPSFSYEQFSKVINKQTRDLFSIKSMPVVKRAFLPLEKRYVFEIIQLIANSLYAILSPAAITIRKDAKRALSPEVLVHSIKASLATKKQNNAPDRSDIRTKAFTYLINSIQNPDVPPETKTYVETIRDRLNSEGRFMRLILDEIDLAGANLSGLNLSYSSLVNTNLTYTNLDFTNLSNTLMPGAQLNGSHRYQTDFSHVIWDFPMEDTDLMHLD